MELKEKKTQRTHFPVFKGLGRKPTFLGIPTVWFLSVVSAVAFLAMLFGLWLWLSLFIILPIMAAISKTDDRAFEIWILEIKTRMRNKGKNFWGGSSYSPNIHSKKRPWVKWIRR